MTDAPSPSSVYFGYTGPIESGGASRIAAALNSAANEGYSDVHLAFSSPGGYVADGIYLYNHIRAMPFGLQIYNIGSVSSIAVVVFLAAARRYCSAHAMFMTHPSAIFSGAEGQSAERLQASLNAALADDFRTETILRENTRLPDDLLAARRYRDVYIPPQQAIEVGLVESVREFILPLGTQIIQI